MQLKRQKGFTAIETILILVIVGLISFVGWYVYNTKSNTDATLSDAANTQSVAKAGKASATKDWQTVKSPDTTYSFMMPKDWVSVICDSQTTVYISSASTNLAKCQSDATGEANFSVVADTSAQKAPTKGTSDQSFATTQVTVNKVKGYKTTRVTAKDAALNPDTKLITYSFYANGKSYTAAYMQLKDMANDSATFEQIVQTWKF